MKNLLVVFQVILIIIVSIIGVTLAGYIGIWLLLIGGIIQTYTALTATTLSLTLLILGLIKIGTTLYVINAILRATLRLSCFIGQIDYPESLK